MRTPRGLLATLGATLSLVAAAACVLLFTSTLVAVKGWPGLSAPPNSGPVALAPIERQAAREESDAGSADAPVVLGAPATTSAPAAPVGLTPAPAAGESQGAVAGERIETGSAPTTTAPSETQQQASTPVTVAPVGLAPADSGPSIVPAVQAPVSTPVTTQEVAEDDADTGYAPSQRQMVVNALPETDGEWPTVADEETYGSEPESEALAPQTYTRTPATAWPEDEDEARAPSYDELAPTVTTAPDALDEREQPRESARTSEPEADVEEPQPAIEPDPEPASGQPEPAPAEKPAEEKPAAEKPAEEKPAAEKPTQKPAQELEAQPDPCPPAPQPEPEPEPQPCPPEQAPAPAPQTSEPQPAPPASEQAPATQPCP